MEVVEKARMVRPQTVDLIRAGKMQLVLNTPLGPHAHSDGAEIRSAAIAMNVPLLTTLSAAMAAVSAIQAMRKKELKYRSLQSHFDFAQINHEIRACQITLPLLYCTITAYVTGGWGERGSKTGNCQSSETSSQKRAESQPSGAPPENETILFPQRNRSTIGVYCAWADR